MGDFDFGFINQNRSISSNGNQQVQNRTLLSNNKYDFNAVKQAFLNNNEPKDIYINYGDADPEGNGGIWIKADTRKKSIIFKIIRTIPDNVWKRGPPTGEQEVYSNEFWLKDMITSQNTWKPLADPSHISGAPATPMEAAMNNEMLMVVAGMSDKLEPLTYANNRYSGNYKNILN
ncbi:MAG: hypothetical protein RI531_04720, partial [Haloferacaceae archaeon]|nr:hypothetical protein [Haloferacaceae archaeon]